MDNVLIEVVEEAPIVQVTVAEPNSIVGGPPETAQATAQNENSIESDKYVSVRRLWQGIAKHKALANTFAEKQTYNKGVSLGNNGSPSVNGDFWSDSIDLLTRLAGADYRVPTGKNKVGRVLFVSKDGNNSTAIVGSKFFTFFTIQAAMNAALSGDTIIVFAGTYAESIIVDTKFVDIYFFGKVIVSGDISYTNTSFSTTLTYILKGESTIINGSISYSTNNASTVRVEVLEVNKTGGTAFIHSGIQRGRFEVNNTRVTANFLTNSQDHQGAYNNQSRFFNVTFTGVSLTDVAGGTITTTGIFKECRLNVSSYLALNRTDFPTDLDFICAYYIDCIIRRTGNSTVDLFLFNFSGLGVVKMERCIVKGTFTRLQQGFGGSVSRSSGMYLHDCNFREATFSSGALFNVTDSSNIAQWKVFLDQTILKPTTIVFQAGSLEPAVSNKYIDFKNY